jgi:nitrogen fixation protein NifB
MHICRCSEVDGGGQAKPNVAVATLEGLLVNLHLGEAASLQIWTKGRAGEFVLVEERPAPEPRSPGRWERLAETLFDCRAVLASAVGPTPWEVLCRYGIVPREVEGLVEDGLKAVYDGKASAPFAPRKAKQCCGGQGSGEGC